MIQDDVIINFSSYSLINSVIHTAYLLANKYTTVKKVLNIAEQASCHLGNKTMR